MIRINDLKCNVTLKAAAVMSVLLLLVAAAFGQQAINLTAEPTTVTMPDGTVVPMWGYFCGGAVSGSTASCTALNPASQATTGKPATWSPVVITVPYNATAGTALTINLANKLSFPTGSGLNNIPTSIVIVGQVGGGLGGAPTTLASPSHVDAQGCPTWFIANPGIPGSPCTSQVTGASGTPPAQGPRIQSMATEVAAGATTSLLWPSLKPGTYLLESGTHPSIQVPMGLVGMLVVTTAPIGTTAGQAYPATAAQAAITYNSELPLEFSEIDPVQNTEVDQAVRSPGFNEMNMRTFGAGVTSILVTSGGSGYTSVPAVTISAPACAPTTVATNPCNTTGASGASATAVMGKVITGLALPAGAGTGYTAPPPVSITDTGTPFTLATAVAVMGVSGVTPPAGTGASLTPVLSTTTAGTVGSVTVNSGGTGYVAGETVTFSAAPTGGTTATGTVGTVGTTGAILTVAISNVGAGYTAAPTASVGNVSSGYIVGDRVNFTGGAGGGASGTVATVSSTGAILTVNLTNAGASFTSAPTITVGGTGASLTPVLSTTTAGTVGSVTVNSGGSGYIAGDIVTFSASPTTGGTATGTVGAVNSLGAIQSVTITNAGTGYTAAPTVLSVGGTGAALTAAFGVSGFTITNPGSGYTTPSATIPNAAGTGTVALGVTTAGTTGSVYAVTINNSGARFGSAPSVTIAASPTGAANTATAIASVSQSCSNSPSGSATSGVANGAAACYPSAVNYTPFYYLINGVAFDKTNAANSVFQATAGTQTTSNGSCAVSATVLSCPATTGISGTTLLRLVNAGLRMHTPSIVGSAVQGFTGAGVAGTVQGFGLVAEDGNVLPNVATATAFPAALRVQTDVLMVPSKVYDVLINAPVAAAAGSTVGALPIYARDLALSGNSSNRDAGMLAYISVNNVLGAPGSGVLPASPLLVGAVARADSYAGLVAGQPYTVGDPSKGVLANDTNVYGATLLAAPTNGTLTCPAAAAVQGLSDNGICANGTFTWTPLSTTSTATSDSFSYCANGTVTAGVCSSGLTATVSLSALAGGTGPVANAITYTSNMATFIRIASPGVLSVDSDGANLPLHVAAGSATPGAGVTLVMDPQGGFTASVATAGTYTFTYKAQNSAGLTSSAATVTLIFPQPSNLQVHVLDAQLYNKCQGNATCITGITPLSDYRWIIEEDQTFYVDPNCTANSSITTPGCPTVVAGPAGQTTIPTFGVNFHTSAMTFVAQGCTGPLSCEYGQTMLDTNPASPTFGTHINAVCDLGNGACRPDPGNGTSSGGFAWVNPSQVHLDPSKRYYISVLPGDAGNPFPAYLGQPLCPNGTNAGPNTGGMQSLQCGHTMSGAPIAAICNIFGAGVSGPACSTTTAYTQPVNVLVLPTPLPTGKLSVLVFEDDWPLNGEQDGGGGAGTTVAPIEPGLGGFNIVLWDTYGGLGDVTGQDTYDMFNQPLSNSLAGTIDPATGLDACPLTPNPLQSTGITSSGSPGLVTGNGFAGGTPATGMTGMIVTCPKYESDGFTLSPLAGQAVIANLMPEKFSVQAYPAADRIGRGEQWVQTNTLDGQHPHDSFIRIGEPGYFQEFGPAGYHVSIGFANPAIINARLADVCAGNGTPGSVGPCTNTVSGQVDVERLSRTPDQRLYASGTRDALAWTQCWVSLGDPDGEDFMFQFCDAKGNFKFTGVPSGNWRVTLGDQWNDQIIDGLSLPANVGCNPNGAITGQATTCSGGQTLSLGNVGSQQWQANLYTRTFIDNNKNGIFDAGDVGIPLVYTMIHYRDGHNANVLSTDFNGIANFNETFPLFNWYVVEADSGRYKTTGIHTVYDAGGPADGTCGSGTRPCGTSTGYLNLANTYESVPLPSDLRVPGAVYCAAADCAAEAAGFAAGTASTSTTNSTGRIDPPWVWAEGFSGMTSQGNWIDFGKAPYAVNENGGIHGLVVYAATRPFDDASQMIQQPWEPNVPGVVVNLYQEGLASDGVTPTLKMVDTTVTSSWDAWAQGFYPSATAGSGTSAGSRPYLNCPGQGTATGTNADVFFYTLYNQPNWLDYYASIHSGGTAAVHALPYNSQYKCYDAMHIWNQLQPAPYDGRYFFPSSLGIDPTTGKAVTTMGSTNGVASNMAGTNCTICIANPDTTDKYRVGTPMLPPGKYVVQVIMPPGYEVYKEEDKNLLIGDNFVAPVTQQFGGLGTDIFIVPDQASVASLYDESAAGYNPNNFQDSTTALGLNQELSGVPGFPGFQDPLWPCVGEQRVVPDYLSLFPQTHEVAPFAGATRPLCDRKEVTLANQMSVSAKFFIYTSTHIASKFTGVITDDFTSEFDPFSPQFGEKFAPPNEAIATKDYLGNELSRVYSDHWGIYNGLTFSSWEVNPPNITGYSPTMQVQCMNDPGPILDTRATILNTAGAQVPNPTFGKMIQDPLYNSAYSNFCYEEPYMPGLTTYLDTPVVPTEAFVGAGYNNVDCAYPDATPAVAEVDGDQIGPYVSASGHTLTIKALGDQSVSNNAYSGPSANVAPFNMKFIPRHYGFGGECLSPAAGSATCNTLSSVTIGGQPAVVNSWSDTAITVTVPSNVPSCPVQQQAQYSGASAQCGQLLITAGNGKQSVDSVTVTIGGKAPVHVPANQTIQSFIDAALPGDLIIVDPNCMTVATPTAPSAPATCSTAALNAATPTQTASPSSHQEMLIMWKPVRLQGVGAPSSVINANAIPAGMLLNPWRRHINCLFGLTLQGQPYTTATTGTGAYDPTGTYTCPDAAWNPTTWSAIPNNPQIDRIPLEAVLGWDATLNGNLAEQLQEPSLMGAFEGAGITVLAKGVEFHGQIPWSDGATPAAFPAGTTLLTGVVSNPAGGFATGDANTYCHTVNYTTTPVSISSQTNPYPSNFICNPSSIDGLSIVNSSQGGGGIFAHGWSHYLQVANNRVYNNAGTLTGGISIGQGEMPTAVVVGSTTNGAPGSCSDGTGFFPNQHLPYCLQLFNNVHNNYITNNSSLGDELFSATLSGGGGATFCTGSDYYKFNYNWVCGNLASGEGGGMVHLGESQDGDIEHNAIILNQATNPTIPTNGGGIMVQGTPDTDPVCGLIGDSDCPPGLSDGVGHNLVINANLIQGNSADSGAGGGIRLQQVNGTEVSTFPGVYAVTAADEGHTVTIVTPATAVLPAVGNTVTIAGVSVAGYNGTFTVTRVGRNLFTYLATATGLAQGAGGTFLNTTVVGSTAQIITTATETAPTTVTLTTSPTLTPTVGDTVTVTNVTPAGYNGTFTVTGVPAGTGTFTYTASTSLLAAGAGGSVTDSNPNQATTALWNKVVITNNMIVNNLAGWDGAGISLQDSLNVAIINNTIASNDSLASSGVLTQSIGTPQASAPPGSCPGAGTSTGSCPQSAGVTSTLHSSVLATSITGLPAGSAVTCPPGQPNCTAFSNPLLQNNVIFGNRSFNLVVGALGAGNLNQQNLVTLSPTIVQSAVGACGTGANYWDLGIRGDTGPSSHSGGFALNPTYSVLDDPADYPGVGNIGGAPGFVTQYCNGSRVPPTCTVANGCAGPNGYGVPPGIADAMSPNPLFTLNASATVDEGNNWVNVSFGPLSLADDSVIGGANGNYGGGNPLGNYALVAGSTPIDYVPVTATTLPSGMIPQLTTDFYGNPRPDAANPNHFDVGAVEFQGNGAQRGLLSISPNSGNQGTVVNVTITGTNLTGATGVTVSGPGGGGVNGITVTNFAAVSSTTVTATFTISSTAAATARNINVQVGGANVGPVTFTVTTSTTAPTLTSICVAGSNPCNSSEPPNTSQNVTLTGTNFAAGATVNVVPVCTGAGCLTISNFVVVSSTSITATFNSTGATPGVWQIDVVSGGLASNTMPFTVSGPVLTSIAPASATKNATGTTVVPVTLTGTGLTGITAVNVSGGGVTVSGITPSTTTPDTTVSATFTFSAGATTTARNVTATTPVGISNAVTFTLVAQGPAPVLSSITPNSVTQTATGATVNVTLTGTGLTGITAVNITGSGAGGDVTVTGVTPSATTPNTTVTATFTFSSTATPSARSVTATTPNGTSNAVTFTLVSASSTTPTLSSITPNSVARNAAGTTTVPVTLTGTGLTGITAVNVSGGGVTVTGITPSTTTPDTTVSATFTFTAGASTTARSVTATTPGGTSNGVTFTLLSAPGVLNSIAPNTGTRGSTQTVTFTGCGIAGSTAVSFVGAGGGTGITVSAPTTTITGTGCPGSPDTVTATFSISPTAALTARNVGLASPTGNTNTVVFTVVSPGTPVLTSITPNSGLRGQSVPVVIAGSGFTTTGTTVNVAAPANGVSVTGAVVTSSATACGTAPVPCITATVVIQPTPTNTTPATIGPRQISVTTPGGTSGTATFTVNGPVLSSISPNQGVRGTAVAVSLFGTGLTGTTGITVSGSGVAVSNIAVQTDSQVNATFTIAGNATLGGRNVTITGPAGGPTNSVAFTVLSQPAPTLTGITPNRGVRGSGTATTPYYPAVNVTLTGTNLTAATGVTVSGAGVTVSNLTVVSSQTATATFTIATNATLGAHNVSITTPAGTGTLTGGFTVVGPTLTGVANPAGTATGDRGSSALNLTFTGTNLSGATSLTGLSGGVTLVAGSLSVGDPCPPVPPTTTCGTTVYAQVNISATATLGARSIAVVTPIGTTNTTTFTVTSPAAPTLTSISPNSANAPAGGTLAVPVTLSGTNFTSTGSTIGGLGAGVTLAAGSQTWVNPITITARFNVASTATLGARNITVTTPGGTTATVPFTVTRATLALSAPAPALNPTPANTGTLTGTITVTNTATGANAGAFTFTAAPTVTPTGTATSGFTVTGGTCASGTVLNPATTTTAAGSCTITVQYASGGSTATANATVTVTGTGLATASQSSAITAN